MDTFSLELKKEIMRRIRSIQAMEKDSLRRVYQITLLLTEANLRLKSFIADYTFIHETDEIRFFKEIKPQLTSNLIYHSQIYNIELNRPVAGADGVREYLNRELAKIQEYTQQHREFVHYTRLG